MSYNGGMQRTDFETALKQTSLLAGLDAPTRDALATRFVAFSFGAGEPIMRAGDEGRHLGVVLQGSAVVQARREDRAFTVELLEPGRVFGEIAFFDAQSPRTADIVGTSPGVVALLPFGAYAELVRLGDPGAEVLEKNVLNLLGQRIQTTNDTLADLLEATRRGTFLDTLRNLVGVRK